MAFFGSWFTNLPKDSNLLNPNHESDTALPSTLFLMLRKAKLRSDREICNMSTSSVVLTGQFSGRPIYLLVSAVAFWNIRGTPVTPYSKRGRQRRVRWTKSKWNEGWTTAEISGLRKWRKIYTIETGFHSHAAQVAENRTRDFRQAGDIRYVGILEFFHEGRTYLIRGSLVRCVEAPFL